MIVSHPMKSRTSRDFEIVCALLYTESSTSVYVCEFYLILWSFIYLSKRDPMQMDYFNRTLRAKYRLFNTPGIRKTSESKLFRS